METEREYNHMVAAAKQLIDKGEDRLSPEEEQAKKLAAMFRVTVDLFI